MNRVLVVDADDRTATFLVNGLTAKGFAASRATSGLQALAAVTAGDIDLVVLDLDLPDGGQAALDTLCVDHPALPTIVLSADLAPGEISRLLTTSAVDHMTKPPQFDELVARVGLRLQASTKTVADPIDCGALRLDPGARRVFLDGTEITMSAREFALVEALARHPGQVLSREQLTSMVWGMGAEPASNAVDVHVRNARRKIGRGRIATVRGIGYRLDADTTEPART